MPHFILLRRGILLLLLLLLVLLLGEVVVVLLLLGRDHGLAEVRHGLDGRAGDRLLVLVVAKVPALRRVLGRVERVLFAGGLVPALSESSEIYVQN